MNNADIRDHKYKAQIALSAGDIELYTWIGNGPGQKLDTNAEGIKLTVTEVYDFWSVLGEIAETDAIAEIDVDCHWFIQDMARVKKEEARKRSNPDKPIIECWYTKLAGVTTRILIECIYLKQGFSNVSGRATKYEDQSIRTVLQLVPTPSWNDVKKPSYYPSFQIDSSSLSEWTKHFMVNTPPNRKTYQELFSLEEEIKQDALALEFNRFEESVDFDACASDAEETERACQKAIQAACEVDNIDMGEFKFTDFGIATHYPLADLDISELTKFARTFMASNIYGQASLLFEFIRKETNRLHTLKNEVNVRIQSLEIVQNQMQEQLSLLAQLQEEVNKGVGEMDERSSEVEALKGQVNVIRMSAPSMARLFQVKFNQRLGDPSSASISGARYLTLLFKFLMISIHSSPISNPNIVFPFNQNTVGPRKSLSTSFTEKQGGNNDSGSNLRDKPLPVLSMARSVSEPGGSIKENMKVLQDLRSSAPEEEFLKKVETEEARARGESDSMKDEQSASDSDGSGSEEEE